MLRVVIEIVLPLLLPTALYLLWVGAVGPLQQHGAVGWAGMPWLWLGGAGLVLLAVALVVLSGGFGRSRNGIYVPPHLQAGRIVPGHFEPRPRR